jgi:DNA-binding transcriptional ArsR family regulator
LVPIIALAYKTRSALVSESEKPSGSGQLYPEKYLRRLLWYLLGGTRGGANRVEILKILRDRPSNANQLADMLHVDYKTVQHHLRVLEENGLVVPSEKGAYGAVLFLTPKMEEALPLLDEIWSRIGRTKIRPRSQEAR